MGTAADFKKAADSMGLRFVAERMASVAARMRAALGEAAGDVDESDPFGEEGLRREEGARPEGGGLYGMACLVALLAMLAALMLALRGGLSLPPGVQQFLVRQLMSGRVEHLSVLHPEALKEVLFGGEPWLVHCSRTGLLAAAFVKAPTYLSNVTRFGVLDCEALLPSSGKSMRDRFKLTGSLFTAANGNGPRGVPPSALSSAYALSAYTRSAVALPITEITQTQQLSSSCSLRPCLLFAERALSADVFKRVSAQNRKLRIGTIPASYELGGGALVLAVVRVPVEVATNSEPASDSTPNAPAEPAADAGSDANSGSAAEEVSADAAAAAANEPGEEAAGGEAAAVAPRAGERWLLRKYDGELGDEAALQRFAASIPLRLTEPEAESWFEPAESTPEVSSRVRAQSSGRAGEASARERMAREEAEYAKSLFDADEEDEDEEVEVEEVE